VTSTLRVAITARSVFPIHGHGGLERSVYDLARYLARHGAEVRLITRSPQTAPPADAIHRSIATTYVPYRTFPLAGRRWTTVIDRSTAYPLFGERAGAVAAAMVEKGDVDIVHGFGASVLGYARRRSALAAPLVLNPQGLEEFGATDPSRARLKRMAYYPLRRAVIACARAADAVIATDRALEPAVRSHLHVPDARIVTIPNALDLDDLQALAGPADGARVRAERSLAGDLVLLSVGRLEENKGFHLLAEALAVLRGHAGRLTREPWRWILVGDGPYRSQLAMLTRQLGLWPNVSGAKRATCASPP
jgi:glycogen synthase